VAIFVLTSILKELQWQIRTETDQTVDQNAEAAVVLEVLADLIRVVVLVVVPADLAAMTAMPNRHVRLGKNELLITRIRLIPSQKHHQFRMKSPLSTFQLRFGFS
jgi:hypothetical protein